MKKLVTLFAVLALSVLALNQGLGQPRSASAGVESFSISSAACEAGKVSVTLNWASTGQGVQYVYWSTQNNGFAAGTFTAHGPLAAGVSSATVGGLPTGGSVFMMIGTVVGSGLDVGKTMTFSTAGICGGGAGAPAQAGAMPYMPYYGNDLQANACSYGFLPYYGYGPQYFDDWDDEDSFFFDDEDDEDEDDEDEDDEDEDDEDDEDEDDEDDFFFLNPCAYNHFGYNFHGYGPGTGYGVGYGPGYPGFY